MGEASNSLRTIWSILSWILKAIGTYQIFKKCGEKPLLAFVPFVREYRLAICADREKEGRTYMLITAAMLVTSIPVVVFPADAMSTFFFSIATLALVMVNVVYSIRVYSGLCETFQRSKRWIIPFLFVEGITSLIWGFGKTFVPNRKVISYEELMAPESGAEAKALEGGLTVNIRERSARDFLQKKVLLRDIHLSIPSGHMVLLLGGSGAGKTTFVNAVTGYEKADATILLKEQDIYKQYEKMKYDVGLVPQQELMRGNDTVAATLSDASAIRLPASIPYETKKARIEDVLQDFGLDSISTSLVEKLSGGQKKRLSIAMEYICDPSLFILDEPDSGLDGVVARNLFEKLRAIADMGKIVIAITHTPDRVIDLFDDVIVLARDASRTGRLAYFGPVREAYTFFGKDSMEQILLAINQTDEGGEGRADEFVAKYAERKVG